MIAKAYLTILFITMTVFIVFNPLDPDAQPVYGSGDDVMNYTSGTYEMFTSGINNIYDTVENAMTTATNFVDAILYIPRTVVDTFSNADGLGDVCTAYADQTPIQRGFLQTQRALYNLLNDPNIETMEAYWIYEQERIYGLVC